ncbi:MAG: neutral zinc metallopeptidase [Gemmatimonadota bacterium]|nr:neutral zinc metallopeptidase [Gemmatimonadota bacterium]
MRPFSFPAARRVGLASLLIVTTALSIAARPAFSKPVRHTADLTETDVTASNVKVGQAYGALVAMWSADFKQLGTSFEAPGIARYRGNVRTQCGIMQANNAQYCPQLNTIFFDEVFVARQAKAAANQLGTDGDMAAVGIIAHEMGHAVAMQLGEASRIPYENEAKADCLAGAFTQQTSKDGSLEKGDLEEAFFGLAAAGDPTPEFTGYERIDARIARRAQIMGHGTREQRLANFKAGFNSGPRACLAAFR